MITRAKSNDHLIRFFEDFPKVTRTELAAKIGCSSGALSSYSTTGKSFVLPPLWTVAAVEKVRREMTDTKIEQKVEPTKVSDTKLFLLIVPTSKVESVRKIVSVMGGEITDV